MPVALHYLRSLREQLDRGERRILIDYPLKFTKGETSVSRCELYVDQNLQQQVAQWLVQYGGFARFMARYHGFDPRLGDCSHPAHFPVHVLSAEGQIAEGRNIFMFFPEVLGLSGGRYEDYFGLELVDVWEAVFDQVVSPCVHNLFDAVTRFDYFETFCTHRPEIIYLASLFHEVGHRVGPWKVSPCRDERMHLSRMQVDIMGELSADTYLVMMLPEFPQLASFVLYQRLFWFGRMQYEQDALHGALNSDNDAWIGAYLWQVAEQVACLSHDAQRGLWHIDKARIPLVFEHVFAELAALGERLYAAGDQAVQLQHWLLAHVPHDDDGCFVYPPRMAAALQRCADIPTRVHLQQPLGE